MLKHVTLLLMMILKDSIIIVGAPMDDHTARGSMQHVNDIPSHVLRMSNSIKELASSYVASNESEDIQNLHFYFPTTTELPNIGHGIRNRWIHERELMITKVERGFAKLTDILSTYNEIQISAIQHSILEFFRYSIRIDRRTRRSIYRFAQSHKASTNNIDDENSLLLYMSDVAPQNLSNLHDELVSGRLVPLPKNVYASFLKTQEAKMSNEAKTHVNQYFSRQIRDTLDSVDEERNGIHPERVFDVIREEFNATIVELFLDEYMESAKENSFLRVKFSGENGNDTGGLTRYRPQMIYSDRSC